MKNAVGDSLARILAKQSLMPEYVAWRRQERSWHTCDGCCGHQLAEREPVVGTLAEVVVLQMRIRWEVDGAEWNVAQQAGTRTTVQTHEAEVANDVYRARFDLARIRRFTLDLQADLDLSLIHI